MRDKKTVLFVSNFCLANTGFGKNAKTVLTYLAKTGKYNLVEMAIGELAPFEGMTKFEKTPWKTYGSLPKDINQQNNLLSSREESKIAGYGYYGIDDVVKECNPDFVIFAEDPWAGNNLHAKPWWDKINCLFWTTVDSEPILPIVLDQAKHMKNYAVWADFAKLAIEKQIPDKEIKALYAAIPLDSFFRIEESERKSIRESFNIQEDDYVIFMNSRNQIRKYFYSNIQAVAQLNKESEGRTFKFLVNTSFSEGWDLMSQCEEYGLSKENFLCSYVCNVCDHYAVETFSRDGRNCPKCRNEKCYSTPNVEKGLSEKDLNILYNISDYYSLPISSGGFEMSILEALTVGLPVGTIEYSFGSTFKDAPNIDYYETILSREIQSNFLKAQVIVDSIVESIKSRSTKEVDYSNREFALNKFDPKITCGWIENWIDSGEKIDFEFDKIEKSKPNPNLEFSELNDIGNKEYVVYLYDKILNRPYDPKGLNDWVEALAGPLSREQVFNIFIKKAKEISSDLESPTYEDFILKSNKKKLAYIMPGHDTDCIASVPVIQSLKSKYPLSDWDYYIVTNPEFKHHFKYLEYLNFIPYSEEFDHFNFTEGVGDNKGLFDIAFAPYITTQNQPYSLHHGKYK